MKNRLIASTNETGDDRQTCLFCNQKRRMIILKFMTQQLMLSAHVQFQHTFQYQNYFHTQYKEMVGRRWCPSIDLGASKNIENFLICLMLPTKLTKNLPIHRNLRKSNEESPGSTTLWQRRLTVGLYVSRSTASETKNIN